MGKRSKARVSEEHLEEEDEEMEEDQEYLDGSSSSNDKSLYEEAKEKFQQLQKDLVGDVIQNLQTFFRAMYKKISEADIEEFEANYRGSESEKKDLLELYKKLKGNMDRLFCCMLCSEPMLDSHRFKDIIDEAISAGDLKSTKAYENGPRKSKKDSEDLYAIIAQRQNERRGKIDSMFSSLVQKYGGGESVPEPSEEEFEAARRKLESRRNCKRK
ncbi:Chaperone protein dnaJ 6 [Sesamum angolense]|uniref:Chaperone protein dnaJ 6 n=1 Tax=Sesamum angolense TaxID=2727404 RepID=A0AAE2C151_9LAMI|nr:Chaperone protein dnaJ 6 [Sesamum angolense]